MPTLTTRPATTADAADPTFGDLLPDHWRSGDNCRSVVAANEVGRVLGHCRGIDNVFHPDSRTLVLEILENDLRSDHPWADVADALLTAQINVSTVPLRLSPPLKNPS